MLPSCRNSSGLQQASGGVPFSGDLIELKLLRILLIDGLGSRRKGHCQDQTGLGLSRATAL